MPTYRFSNLVAGALHSTIRGEVSIPNDIEDRIIAYYKYRASDYIYSDEISKEHPELSLLTVDRVDDLLSKDYGSGVPL